MCWRTLPQPGAWASPATRSTSEPPCAPHLGHPQTPEAPSCGWQSLLPPRDQLHGAPTCGIQAGDQVSGGLLLTHTFITPYKSREGSLPSKEGPVRPVVWGASHQAHPQGQAILDSEMWTG